LMFVLSTMCSIMGNIILTVTELTQYIKVHIKRSHQIVHGNCMPRHGSHVREGNYNLSISFK